MRHSKLTVESIRRVTVLVALLGSMSGAVRATTRGPDAGGYTGTDAAVYSFVDLSGPGGAARLLSGVDDGTAALTLSFPFQFYGQTYTVVCASTNGALYLVGNASACSSINDFAHTDLSTTTTPNDLPAILPFWTDLTFQVPGAGAVLYQTLGASGSRRFVVQWNDAYAQGSPNPVSFQVILIEGGSQILFQYKTVALGPGNAASNGGQATVGIRNAGAPGNQQHLAWSFDAPVIGDSSALLFGGATNAAPDCTGARPTVTELWPPNNQFVDVGILGVTDPDGVAPSLTITSIFQDEVTDNDVDGLGIGTNMARLRAQRGAASSRPSNGRVYRIRFMATDTSGASCSSEVKVSTPLAPAQPAIDDGALYDSTVQTR